MEAEPWTCDCCGSEYQGFQEPVDFDGQIVCAVCATYPERLKRAQRKPPPANNNTLLCAVLMIVGAMILFIGITIGMAIR